MDKQVDCMSKGFHQRAKYLYMNGYSRVPAKDRWDNLSLSTVKIYC